MREIKLRWTPRVKGAEQRVYRGTTPFDINSTPAILDTLSPEANDYIDTSALEGVIYYYAIGVYFESGIEILTPTKTVVPSGTIVEPPVEIGPANVFKFNLSSGSNFSISSGNSGTPPCETEVFNASGGNISVSSGQFTVPAQLNGWYAWLHAQQEYISSADQSTRFVSSLGTLSGMNTSGLVSQQLFMHRFVTGETIYASVTAFSAATVSASTLTHISGHIMEAI